MFTNFPNGVTSLGIPLVGSGRISIPNKNGKVIFVDKTNGSDGNLGDSPNFPVATITQALTLSTSGAGDTIYVFPGTYVENVTVSKNDVSIIAAYQESNSKRVGIAPLPTCWPS